MNLKEIKRAINIFKEISGGAEKFSVSSGDFSLFSVSISETELIVELKIGFYRRIVLSLVEVSYLHLIRFISSLSAEYEGLGVNYESASSEELDDPEYLNLKALEIEEPLVYTLNMYLKPLGKEFSL